MYQWLMCNVNVSIQWPVVMCAVASGSLANGYQPYQRSMASLFKHQYCGISCNQLKAMKAMYILFNGLSFSSMALLCQLNVPCVRDYINVQLTLNIIYFSEMACQC